MRERNHKIEKLKTHIEWVHKENKPYKCSFCDYSASQTQYLKSHIDFVHEGTKPLKIKAEFNFVKSEAAN